MKTESSSHLQFQIANLGRRACASLFQKPQRSCIIPVITVIPAHPHPGVQGFRCTRWLCVLRWGSAPLRMPSIPNPQGLYSPLDVLGFLSTAPGNTHGNCKHESLFEKMNPHNFLLLEFCHVSHPSCFLYLLLASSQSVEVNYWNLHIPGWNSTILK